MRGSDATLTTVTVAVDAPIPVATNIIPSRQPCIARDGMKHSDINDTSSVKSDIRVRCRHERRVHHSFEVMAR
jgi:hypothetical protein